MVLDFFSLKRDLARGDTTYVWRQAETLSVGQGEQLVVVQHRVEILYPLGVHVTIKDDPLPFLQLASHVVNDPGMKNPQNNRLIN